jgi:hypothetical protein
VATKRRGVAEVEKESKKKDFQNYKRKIKIFTRKSETSQ